MDPIFDKDADRGSDGHAQAQVPEDLSELEENIYQRYTIFR